jgi:hypothetical protein
MAGIEFVSPPKNAKMPATKVAQPCADGRRTHHYGDDGLCKFCGYKRPYPQAQSRRTGAPARERPPQRASTAVVSQAKARAIIFSAGAITQRMALQLIEDEEARGEWEKDALSAEELLMLSDALADEAVRSRRIMAWLAALDSAGPHAKLATVGFLIALPRLARHGVIPQAVADELAGAAALALASGSPRDSDRRDGRWEVDAGGGGFVASPTVPAGEPDEDGSGTPSSQVPGAGGNENPQNAQGSEIRPNRTADGGETDGGASEGELPRPLNGVGARGMDRIRR